MHGWMPAKGLGRLVRGPWRLASRSARIWRPARGLGGQSESLEANQIGREASLRVRKPVIGSGKSAKRIWEA